MAFYDPNDEEQQDPNQQNSGPQTGPGSSVITGGQASAAPKAAGSPDSGGNFVGLQTYLSANKPQAEKLGDQTAGVLSNSINSARDSVSGLNSKFNQQVDQNTIASDNDALNVVSQGAEKLTQPQRDQVKKQYNASYKGPSQLADLGDDYSTALKNSNAATQSLTDAQTEEGRGNLINKINSAPRTQGITAFDNILLQKGPGRDKIQGVVDQNADVKNLMGNSQAAAQQKVGMIDDPNTPDVNEATGAKGITQQTQSKTLKAVQDALSAWQSGFNPRLAAAQDSSLKSRLSDDIGAMGSDPYLNEETMNSLGLTANQRIYRRNLGDYLGQFSPTDVNAANVATNEDYARYGALADLAGIKDLALKPEDISKAGTAPKFKVDTQKLSGDLSDDEYNYQQKYNNQTGITGTNWYPAVPLGTPGIDKPSFGQMTPKDIERAIPALRGINSYWGEIADKLQADLNNFKAGEGYNNMAKTDSQKFDPGRSIFSTLPVKR